jgi:AhpD family alkylhydroperoxidase
MEQRLDVGSLEPQLYKTILSSKHAISKFELDKKLIHLVNLRVSQINGCGYCVNMHSLEAIEEGEAPQRVYTVSTWWEVPFFTDAERAVFKMAEEITRISEKGLTENTYQQVLHFFGPNKVVQWLFVIMNINSLNRMAISMHKVAELVH